MFIKFNNNLISANMLMKYVKINLFVKKLERRVYLNITR